jgi:hypothetical protein
LDRALNIGFLVLFDTLFRALVVVLMAFNVEGLFGGGLVIFFAGFLLAMLLAQHNKTNQIDRRSRSRASILATVRNIWTRTGDAMGCSMN